MVEAISDVFRAVNDRIRELEPIGDKVAFFLCECPDPTCFRSVHVPLADFDATRAAGGTIVADTCTHRDRDADAPNLADALSARVAVPVRDAGLPVEGAPAG